MPTKITKKKLEEQQKSLFDTDNQKVMLSLRLNVITLEHLEEMLYHIKRTIPREKRSKLNRSKLIEIMIEANLLDSASKKEKSVILQEIAKWKNN